MMIVKARTGMNCAGARMGALFKSLANKLALRWRRTITAIRTPMRIRLDWKKCSIEDGMTMGGARKGPLKTRRDA